mgnify:CR=1 FL=1
MKYLKISNQKKQCVVVPEITMCKHAQKGRDNEGGDIMELRKLKTYKIQLISINLDKYNKINNLALLTKNFVGRILNNMKAPPIFSLCSLRNFFYLSIVNKQVLTEDAYIYFYINGHALNFYTKSFD